MTGDRLHGVYDLENQEETDAYYSSWAATYDEELTRNGYRTPQRCATALARAVSLDTKVLDVGCGTGLSGEALAAEGFTDIVGQDVNAEMLERARDRDVYRDLWVSDLDDPFPFESGTFGAITAIGVIGIGAAPASLLGESLDALAPGGHLVFSYNDHALATPEFSDALVEVVTNGIAEQLSAEHGPHIDALGSFSTVYVLRRR